MSDKRKHMLRLRRGEGELIGYMISMILLLYLMIIVLSFTVLHLERQKLDNLTRMISRKCVVCESMEDAQKTAKNHMKAFFKKQKNSCIQRPRITVSYTPGGGREWAKGQYIDIIIQAKIKTYEPITTRMATSKTTVMIERAEKDEEE